MTLKGAGSANQLSAHLDDRPTVSDQSVHSASLHRKSARGEPFGDAVYVKQLFDW